MKLNVFKMAYKCLDAFAPGFSLCFCFLSRFPCSLLSSHFHQTVSQLRILLFLKTFFSPNIPVILFMLRCHSEKYSLTVLCFLLSWVRLCDPMNYSPPGSVHGDSPGKNTGVGCNALLQGIFPTQGLNPGLLHCRWILYHLSHQESLRILEWVT